VSNLLMFLPDEAYPLVLVLLGIAAIAGLARPRLLLGFVVFLASLPVIESLLDAALDAMPLWLSALLAGAVLFSVLRAMLSMLIGAHAASHAIGNLVASGVKALIRAAVLPLRFAHRALFR
jgi:hypothetical protein